MTTEWTRADLSRLSLDGSSTTKVFTEPEARRALPDLYLWDIWPVRSLSGEVSSVRGHELWMALSAPADIEPVQRHDVARIRLMARREDAWMDLGDLLGDAALGSRQWAGSAVFDHEHERLDVFYTAAGREGEDSPTFIQRIVGASAYLDDGRVPSFADWTEHRELATPTDHYFSTLNQLEGRPGLIKAFRDPFPLLDDGRCCLLFTATMLGAETDFNGAVGWATGESFDSLGPRAPLITADGVNNELERPHVVRQDDLIYLFFSTQTPTFHPDVTGPTGLYGFVSDRLEGDWQPLNGSGLVLANPPEEPFQAYSWLVLDDLRVVSFVDYCGLGPSPNQDPDLWDRSHFKGTVAPFETLQLDGESARLVNRS